MFACLPLYPLQAKARCAQGHITHHNDTMASPHMQFHPQVYPHWQSTIEDAWPYAGTDSTCTVYLKSPSHTPYKCFLEASQVIAFLIMVQILLNSASTFPTRHESGEMHVQSSMWGYRCCSMPITTTWVMCMSCWNTQSLTPYHQICRFLAWPSLN